MRNEGVFRRLRQNDRNFAAYCFHMTSRSMLPNVWSANWEGNYVKLLNLAMDGDTRANEAGHRSYLHHLIPLRWQSYLPLHLHYQ